MSFRCGLCNAVSSIAIETNPGDFSNKPFWVDPKSPLHYICDSCHDEYQEQIVTYQEDDDLENSGWSNMETLYDHEEEYLQVGALDWVPV